MNVRALSVVEGTCGVVCSFRDGPFKYRAAVVVVYVFDIGREYDLVVVVDLDCEVCPPHKGVGNRCRVVYGYIGFYVRAVIVNTDGNHALHLVEIIDLAHENGFTVGGTVHVHKCRGSVVLRPVELNAACDPRTCKTNHCGLYYLVVINEIVI